MKMLIVRLRVDQNTPAYLSHSLYEIKEKTEKEYILEVNPGNIDFMTGPKKVVPIRDVNMTKYVEFFIHTEESNYWYVDGSVYCPLTEEQLKRIDVELHFWKHQLFKLAKKRLKDRNKGLKEVYYAIDDLSFEGGNSSLWIDTK